LKTHSKKNFMEKVSTIGNSCVKVIFGDLTKIRADAYVVPQFTTAASYGGVGGAIARSGALKGIEAYEAFVDGKGTLGFSSVLMTEAGGGNAKHLLHTVSVGSARADEFSTVRNGLLNALRTAAENGLTSIVAPAMGTGIIGKLTAEQSARAMMSAIELYGADGTADLTVSIAIFGDEAAYNAFNQVLESRSYVASVAEPGARELDFGRWVIETNSDMIANKRAFG
jgi:O-acetyl-ADP-ribose deacetylase (regulator of RNase III)